MDKNERYVEVDDIKFIKEELRKSIVDCDGLKDSAHKFAESGTVKEQVIEEASHLLQSIEWILNELDLTVKNEQQKKPQVVGAKPKISLDFDDIPVRKPKIIKPKKKVKKKKSRKKKR